jgi:hypothetical protein
LDRIGALVGSSLDQTEGLSVEGKIEKNAGRYWLTLSVRDGREVRKRVIGSDSCADLAGAAAVTLALLLGIEVRSTEPENTTQGAAGAGNGSAGAGDQKQPTAPPKASAAPPPKPAPKASPGDAESKREWAFVIRAPIGSAELGPLPDPTLALGLGLGARYESWLAVLSGRISRRQTVTAPALGSNVSADLDRITGELATCRGFRWGTVEVAPCFLVAVEYVTARGSGDGVTPGAQHTAWPALGVGGAAHFYATESLAFFVTLAGYVELARPRLVIEGLGEVGQLTPFAGGLGLGVEWIL